MKKLFLKIFGEKEVHEYSDLDDISYILNNAINNLDKDIVNKGILHIKEILDSDTIEQIKIEHKNNPKSWWALYHHGWGTAIRNSLRDKVCFDDKLPSGNWDDYYIQIVEMALDLR